MRTRSTVCCLLLTLLAGCAGPAAAPVTQAVPPSEQRATILAVRRVPINAPEPARVLLADLGMGGTAAGDSLYEYVVRTEGGTIWSIVQPGAGSLHPGASVGIVLEPQVRIVIPRSG